MSIIYTLLILFLKGQERNEECYESILLSSQDELKQNDNSVTGYLVFHLPDDIEGHGMLVTCCNELYGIHWVLFIKYQIKYYNSHGFGFRIFNLCII